MSCNLSKFGLWHKRVYSAAKIFYTKNHEWIKVIEDESSKQTKSKIFRAKIGITDYSQKALGDIVFIDMPKVDSRYHAEGSKLD